MLPVALKITRTIEGMLEDIQPDMLTDIFEDGLILGGGSAFVFGLDRLISRKTNLQVTVPPAPDLCAVRGAGAAIRYVKHLDDGAYGVINPLHRSNEG
jgi:rod shape-determining protein MreB